MKRFAYALLGLSPAFALAQSHEFSGTLLGPVAFVIDSDRSFQSNSGGAFAYQYSVSETAQAGLYFASDLRNNGIELRSAVMGLELTHNFDPDLIRSAFIDTKIGMGVIQFGDDDDPGFLLELSTSVGRRFELTNWLAYRPSIYLQLRTNSVGYGVNLIALSGIF